MADLWLLVVEKKKEGVGEQVLSVLPGLEGRGHEILRQPLIVLVHVHLSHCELEFRNKASVRILGRVIDKFQHFYRDILDYLPID